LVLFKVNWIPAASALSIYFATPKMTRATTARTITLSPTIAMMRRARIARWLLGTRTPASTSRAYFVLDRHNVHCPRDTSPIAMAATTIHPINMQGSYNRIESLAHRAQRQNCQATEHTHS
jgi:hypothetical protein